MVFVAALERLPVRSALWRYIPKPVIINGLVSTGKKKKKRQSLKTPDKRNPCRQSKNKLKDPL